MLDVRSASVDTLTYRDRKSQGMQKHSQKWTVAALGVMYCQRERESVQLRSSCVCAKLGYFGTCENQAEWNGAGDVPACCR